MSLDSIRHAALDAKKNEIAACQRHHRLQVATLYRLTKLLAAGGAGLFNLDAPPSPDESIFLDKNDISQGRQFQEALLLPLPPATSTVVNPPNSAPVTTQPLATAQNPSTPATTADHRAGDGSRLAEALKSTTPPHTAVNISTSNINLTPSRGVSPPPQSLAVDSTDSGVNAAAQVPNVGQSSPDQPRAAAPTTDTADHQGRTLNEPELQTRRATKAATVIHLPPKAVQEKHLHDIQKAQEVAHERERREDAEAGLPINAPATEAPSSPSSTAGAASAATSKPGQHSPDTSPEATNSPLESAAPSDELVSDPSSRQSKPLASAGDVHLAEVEAETEEEFVTPDAQLRQEQEARQLETVALGRGKSTKGMGSGNVNDALFAEAARLQTQPAALPNNVENVVHHDSTGPQDVAMEDRSKPEAADTTPITPRPTANFPNQDQPVQRMTTRVASGAIRQKSVSEILGGLPKPSLTPSHERTPSTSQILITSSRANRKSVPTTPSEDRSKHSMVVFSKRDKDISPRGLENELDGYLAMKGASLDPNKDYMKPLFMNQAYQPPRAQTLTELVHSANKTLSTSNLQASLRELLEYRVLRRIYFLQNANKWSLRQMAKFQDPRPPVTHQDHLLSEMKWMRTDFREERRWKMQVARNLADWCKLYVEASEDVKQHLRIKTRPPTLLPRVEQTRDAVDDMDATPSLDHSEETASDAASPPIAFPPLYDLSYTPPTAIFSLDNDDVVFHLDLMPASDSVLRELPLYDPKASDLQKPLMNSIPVSKFAKGKLIPVPNAAPRKRSRFEYEEEEGETTPSLPIKRRQSEVSLFMSPSRRSTISRRDIQPERAEVALFDPLSRHIRERLHATHAFRPPSEFLMPSTDFFESRTPSQWTWEEDQQLRACVKKFSYNWSLISMEMTQASQPSKFVAGTERRTPWECFERWVSLEGLPNDMGKTQYFKEYTRRLEAANKAVIQQKAAQQQTQQQAQTPGQIIQPRLKGTQPIRVEKRREARHVSMIDAIRKLVRKREQQLHRQQESARNQMLRKQQQQNSDATPTRTGPMHTPAEFSRVRQERDQKIQERQEVFRQQMLHQQRIAQQAQMSRQTGIAVNAAQQQQLQPPQQHPQQRVATPNGAQLQNAGVTAMGPSPPNSNMQQARHPARSTMQGGIANGAVNGMPMGMGGVPQAQMQSIPGQQRLQADSLRIALAQQSAQNQFGIQHRQGNASNLAAAHLSPQNGTGMSSQQVYNAYQQAARAQALQQQQQLQLQQNGALNGMQGPATSPRPGPGLNGTTGNGAPQALSSGAVPTLNAFQHQIAKQFPSYTPEQQNQLAHEKLKQYIAKLQHSAVQAAAGGNTSAAGMLNSGNALAAMASMQNANLQNTNSPFNAAAFNMAANMNANMGMNMGASNGLQGSPSPQQYQQQLARQMQAQQNAARLSGSPGAAGMVRPGSAASVGHPGASNGLSRSATPMGQQ